MGSSFSIHNDSDHPVWVTVPGSIARINQLRGYGDRARQLHRLAEKLIDVGSLTRVLQLTESDLPNISQDDIEKLKSYKAELVEMLQGFERVDPGGKFQFKAKSLGLAKTAVVIRNNGATFHRQVYSGNTKDSIRTYCITKDFG